MGPANPPSHGTRVAGRVVTLVRADDENADVVVGEWVKEARRRGDDDGGVVMGLDCEWQAPWFRGPGQKEKVAILQLANATSALILRTLDTPPQGLPTSLVDLLADPQVIKVGVNIRGDAGRLSRDLPGVKVKGLHDLTYRAQGVSSNSLRALAQRYLGINMENKDDKKVSCSDWGKWPLEARQVEYAVSDATTAYDIYSQGPPEIREREGYNDDDDGDAVVEGDQGEEATTTTTSSSSSSTGGGGSKMVNDFYRMMRNKTMAPPNKGNKQYPTGDPDVLKGKVFVISGVLDSFERSECSAYISQHGGVVRSSITKATSYLLHDHGEIGPKKVKEAKRLGIPILGEDALLEMIRQGHGDKENGGMASANKKKKGGSSSTTGSQATSAKKRRKA